MKFRESILNFFSKDKIRSDYRIEQPDRTPGNNSPIVLYKISKNSGLSFNYISDTIFNFLGYGSEEFYSDPQLFLSHIHPDDREKFSLLSNYPDDTKLIIHIRLLDRNSRTIYTEHHLQVEKDFINGILFDITERKEAEIRLKESEDRLVVALQTTGIAIWEWDVENSIVSWKNSVENVLGVKKGVINESIDSYFNLIHPDDKQEFLATMSDALQNSDNYKAEHRVIDKNGNIQWIEAYAQIFRDKNGKTTRWLGTLRNITSRIKREEETNQLLERNNLQSRSIVDLAINESFYQGKLEESLKILLRMAANVLDVEEASLWFFQEDYSVLECAFRYIKEFDKIEIGAHKLISSEVPNYFRYMLESRVLVSGDAMNDPLAKEFLDTYSSKVNLGAFMDSSIRVRGKIVGIICIESINKTREWKSDEIMYAGLLADQAAIAIINSERKQSEEQVRLLNKNLERIVEERTLQLKETNKDLSQTLDNLSKTQNQLILSEKMASLGQLIAGIAHEINNPIGTIKASLELVRSQKKPLFHDLTIPNFLRNLDGETKSLSEDFYLYALQLRDIPTGIQRRKTKNRLQEELEEKSIRNASYLAEKFIDVGVLKIPFKYKELLNSPFAEEILNYLADKIFEEKNYESIESSISRVASIIRSLKNFTHTDSSSRKTLFSVEDSLETVITLFYSKFKKGVEVIRNFQKVPMFLCYPDDLIQLWTNLIQNAIQAMDYRGNLEIRLKKPWEKPLVIVEIIDSGKGIPTEVQEKIFEPFFTTKALGEGSGLGLDICKKIVESHKGKIECESEPGRTLFRVTLPVS